jgi:predicted amidohydrolase YtcJ
MSVLLRDVAFGPARRRVDVRVDGGRVQAMGERLRASAGDAVLSCDGGWLVPGLADHHVHLGAWLRAARSTLLASEAHDEDWWRRLDAAGTRGTGWHVIFGLDHHHETHRILELAERLLHAPTLIVHRTGHAGFLNRAGAGALGRGDDRILGRPGTVWRAALGPCPAGLEERLLRNLRAVLLRRGVTLLQDATPYVRSASETVRRRRAVLAPIAVRVMGHARDPIPDATHVKVLDPLNDAPATGGPLAVHAVEPEEIVAAVKMVDANGRIEHAAVCPPPLVDQIAHSGATVCANPGFLVHRREALWPVLKGGDASFFQPLADFLMAGVPLRFGSDAPVTPPDPWAAVRGACSPRTARAAARQPAPIALRSALRAVSSAPDMLADDAEPESWLGRPADLVVLAPAANAVGLRVASTIAQGRLVFSAENHREKEAQK